VSDDGRGVLYGDLLKVKTLFIIRMNHSSLNIMREVWSVWLTKDRIRILANSWLASYPALG